MTSAAYLDQVECVRWFRARAARDRYREELEILDEEFRRTWRSFTQMSVIWKTIGDRQFTEQMDNHRLASGYRAFAYRQADIYARLAHNTAENWNKARSHTT